MNRPRRPVSTMVTGSMQLSSNNGPGQHQRSISTHLSNMHGCHKLRGPEHIKDLTVPSRVSPILDLVKQNDFSSSDAVTSTSQSEVIEPQLHQPREVFAPSQEAHHHPPLEVSMSEEIEEIDETGPVVKPERFSFQSSSKDSGVVMDLEELAPSSYFDDSSDDEMGEDDHGDTIEGAADEEGRLEPNIDSELPIADLRIDATTEAADSDDQETITQEVTEGEVDRILTFTLRSTYGIELADLGQGRRRDLCRDVTLEYAENLAHIVENVADSTENDNVVEDASEGESFDSDMVAGEAGSSGEMRAADTGSNGASPGELQQGDQSTSMKQDNQDSMRMLIGSASKKRPMKEDTRLRCPFRARNQMRFNIRDHQGCALTCFTSMADLRQHVVKKHHRDDPNKFPCHRCNEVFTTKREQQLHAKQATPCESRPVDPEDGVDGETARRILDRNRQTTKCGGDISVEAQWNELWTLIFPDSQETPVYDYHAVMEDCDLETEYKGILSILADSLQRRFGLVGDDTAVAELQHMLVDNFLMAVESCRMRARTLEHTNRQKSPNIGTNTRRRTRARGFPEHQFLRDSGIGTEMSSVRASTTFSVANSGHMSWGFEQQAQLAYTNSPGGPSRMGLPPLFSEALAANEALLASQQASKTPSYLHPFGSETQAGGLIGMAGPANTQFDHMAQAPFHQRINHSLRRELPIEYRALPGYDLELLMQPVQNMSEQCMQQQYSDQDILTPSNHAPGNSGHVYTGGAQPSLIYGSLDYRNVHLSGTGFEGPNVI